MPATLCKSCGYPMQLVGNAYVCRSDRPLCRQSRVRAPLLGIGATRGGWPWAIGLALATASLMALALHMGAGFLKEEPLLFALGLGFGGAAIGWAPTFGYRMFRQHPDDWTQPGSVAMLVSSVALAACALAAVAGKHGLPQGVGYALALGGGCLAGLVLAYLPHSCRPASPGQMLVKGLEQHLGRSRSRSTGPLPSGCAIQECPDVGIECGRCRQKVLCGTHWIKRQGKCACGYSFQLAPPPMRTGQVLQAQAAQLAMMAAGAAVVGSALLFLPT